MGLSARNETETAFNRDLFHDRNWLICIGSAAMLPLTVRVLKLFLRRSHRRNIAQSA